MRYFILLVFRLVIVPVLTMMLCSLTNVIPGFLLHWGLAVRWPGTIK